MEKIFDISDTLRLRIGFFVFLCLLSTLAFEGQLSHPMNVVGDEPAAIQDAKLILENPLHWISDQRVMVVRPPVDLFFMIGWVLWGELDAGYQGFQVFFHLVAAWLVFFVLRKMRVDTSMSMVAAVLFLVNVAHYRTVQWVICVNYVLTCIFVLMAVWFLLHYFETKNRIFLFGVAGLIGCAVFSHPAGVAIVIFCVYLLWQQKESVYKMLFVVGAGILFTGLAFWASPNHMQVQGVVNTPDLNRMLSNPIWYLGRLITSAHWFSVLAIQNEPNGFELTLGMLFLVCVAWLLVRRRTWIFTSWAIFTVVMVLPFVNNATDRQIVGPSRQLYLASVGGSVLLAWAIFVFCQKLKRRRLQQSVLLCTIFIFIWVSVLSLKKAEAIDYWLVGRSYVASRQIERGLTLFDDAYAHGRDILPINFYTQYAILAFGTGQAIASPLQYAFEIYPNNAHIEALLGVTAFISNDSVEHLRGQEQIVSAIQNATYKQDLAQDLTAALQNAGGYLHKNQDYDRAIALYQLVLNIRPNYAMAWVNLGRAYFSNQLYEKGINALLRATELQPEFWEAWQTLGDMLYEVSDYANAVAAFQNAYELNPQMIELPYMVGLSYEKLGKKEEAVLWYQSALKINPQHTETLMQLERLGY